MSKNAVGAKISRFKPMRHNLRLSLHVEPAQTGANHVEPLEKFEPFNVTQIVPVLQSREEQKAPVKKKHLTRTQDCAIMKTEKATGRRLALK